MHLEDAEALLNFTEAKRRDEFEREFGSYWSQRVTNTKLSARAYSLVTPRQGAREVAFFFDAKSKRYVIADNAEELARWLRNSGITPGSHQIFTTRLFKLSRPWTPQEFPEVGSEITSLLPPDIAQRYLEPGRSSLFLFEVLTQTGTTFAAVVLRGAERRDMIRGFRHMARVPVRKVIGSYANRPVERHKVARVDGPWVHGRDHHSSYALIKNRKVAVIGCGALGAAVARLLAQAGVGEQILVDGDRLTPANTSRHPLGASDVDFNKASAMQRHLRREFPHLKFDHAFGRRFESLTAKDLDELAGVDLIVTAGIDFDGEAALDHWRRGLERPPAHLSTWVEPYAAVGHAVLVYGKASLLAGFDCQERPTFRLTDWPDESGVLVVEAGCGNSFQPHGVIDLQPTVGMAAGLALDTLLDKVPGSCRRVWMGDPEMVRANGGTPRDDFNLRLTIREFAWP